MILYDGRKGVDKVELDISNMVSGKNFVYNHVVKAHPKGMHFAPHTHDNYELLMVMRGRITYSVEGRFYRLKRGDIILSTPYVIHSITPESDDTYERYNVLFDERNLPQQVRDMLPRGVDVFRLDDYERIHEIFQKIDYYSKHFSDEALSGITESLITEIFYNLAILDAKERNGSVNDLVNTAVAYINENLEKIKNIDDICDALYITKSHLHHIFVKNLQMSPKKYINSKRMMKARKLIRRGARPTEIFTVCGYDDYATFFRNYKKYFGHAPSDEDNTMTPEEIRT